MPAIICKCNSGPLYAHEINDSNFKILGAPAIPFVSERPAAMRVDPAPVPVPGEAVNLDRIADRNVVPNIKGYSIHCHRLHP